MATELSTLTTCINCGIVVRKVRDDATAHLTWLCPNCGIRDVSLHTKTKEPTNTYSNPEKQTTRVRGYALDAVDAGLISDIVELQDNNGIVLPVKANRSNANAAVISESFAATSSVVNTTLTYSMSGQPPPLTINSSSGLVTGTLSTPGVYTTVVTAVDNLKPQNSTSLTITWTVT